MVLESVTDKQTNASKRCQLSQMEWRWLFIFIMLTLALYKLAHDGSASGFRPLSISRTSGQVRARGEFQARKEKLGSLVKFF